MLNKLLSNLPFSPSLINQVSFYHRRLMAESRLRRIGIILVVLTVFVQMFAVVSPPKPSLAASNNDIIKGGVTSKQQLVDTCNNSSKDFATILAYFGLTCTDIANGTTTTIRSTDQNNSLYSLGRLPYGKPNETPVSINNAGTFYLRPLSSWDSGAYSTYTALKVHNAFTVQFYILFNCGNIVQPGAPVTTPAPQPATPTTTTRANDCSAYVVSAPSSVQAGSTFTASFAVTNVVPWANDATYPLRSSSPTDNTTWGKKRVGDFRAVPPGQTKTLSDSFTAPQTAGTYGFYWQLIKEGYQTIGPICGVNITVTAKPVVTTTTPAPAPRCPQNTAYLLSDTKNCVPCPGDNTLLKSDPNCEKCQLPPFVGISRIDARCQPCPYDKNIAVGSSACKPCPNSASNSDVSVCLVLSKTARNVTERISNADGTTAKAGETIEYTLRVHNTGKAMVSGYVVEEDISDILDYANVTDYHKGVKNAQNNIVRWPATDIGAEQTIEKQLTVKIKDPIPQTNSNDGAFDLIMTNVYGNTVNIKLPTTVVKTTEQVTENLPNTGPGTSLVIAFVVTSVAGYFLARSRLLAKELEIVRTDYAAGGF